MIRTRFAPSPTGFLHIGGVRTALFNWLFARQHGGHFVLRIDDTDQQRNIAEALEPILEGFRWLGLDWDEGPEIGGVHEPYFQSQRQANYQAAVETLLAGGVAYRDYALPAELEAERNAAQKEGRRFIYSRQWMAESPEESGSYEAEGRKAVVRLKMPRQGVCRFHDLIRGDVEFEWALEQDHVIQRADGSCLYNLATAVDDQDMEITHIIRAEEHLSNTPRQIFITESLGHPLPQYAHVPYVAEPGSKNKLSKRKLDKYLKNPDFAKLYEHGLRIAQTIGLEPTTETFNPVVVAFYQTVGYLPSALINYLLLLGWSLDDKTEIFTRQEMIDNFSLERVNRSPASFDPQKLWAFEDTYMQSLSVSEKLPLAVPYLEAAELLPNRRIPDPNDYVSKILEAAGDRIKVAGDIVDYEDFFLADDEITYDEKAFEKRFIRSDDAVDLVSQFHSELASTEAFDAASLEDLLRHFVDSKQIKIGQIIHALRIATTGKAVGFGMFEILEILGKERTLNRIDLALKKV